MRRLSMFVGVVSVSCGAFMIWMSYGFATMTDPDVQGPARRSSIVHAMTTGGGATLVGNGLLLISAGLWLTLRKPNPTA